MTIASQRNPLVDNVRGFAILTVVLGHAIQFSLTDSFDSLILFRMIYSFHMPLFFFISGYVNGYKESYSFAKYVRVVLTLIVPFFVWAFLSVPFGRLTFDELWGLFAQGYPYWFLTAMFYVLTIFFVSFNAANRVLRGNFWLVVGAMAVFWVLMRNANLFGLSFIYTFLPYFMLGYLANKMIRSNSSYVHKLLPIRWWVGVVLCLVFAAVSINYHRVEGYSYWFFSHNTKITMLWNYGVAILGIISSFWLFSLIKSDKLNRYLGGILGRFTLEVYVSHYLFLYVILDSICGWPSVWRIVVSFVGATMLSVLFAQMVAKLGWLNMILFGKR